MGEIKKEAPAPKLKVKAVFCCAIAPEYRKQGIAGLLLSRVCQDAQKAGFDVIKGYSNKEFLNTEQGFIGPVKLYKNYGFAACCETDKKLVMRKNYGNSKLLPFPVNRHKPCFIISVSGRPVSGYLLMRELAADNS